MLSNRNKTTEHVKLIVVCLLTHNEEISEKTSAVEHARNNVLLYERIYLVRLERLSRPGSYLEKYLLMFTTFDIHSFTNLTIDTLST